MLVHTRGAATKRTTKKKRGVSEKCCAPQLDAMPKPREATNSSACTFVLRFVNSFATRPHSSLDNYYGQQLGSIINIMYLVLRRFRKEIINDEINAFVFCTLLRSLLYKKKTSYLNKSHSPFWLNFFSQNPYAWEEQRKNKCNPH